MIGNDLVDRLLATTESNCNRKGWQDKIFTQKEQFYLATVDDKEAMIWILWSCKEAAYKVYNRQTKIRAFMPLQLECSDMRLKNGYVVGKVAVMGLTLYTKTLVTTDFIHSIAVSDKSLFAKIRIDFSKQNSLFKDYEVKKDDFGIPFFRHQKTGFEKIASISHHGRYCSYMST